MNYSTGKGHEKRYASGKKKTALVDGALEQSMAKSLLATLDVDKRRDVEGLVNQAEHVKIGQKIHGYQKEFK